MHARHLSPHPSHQIDRVPLELGERAIAERARFRRAQHHARRHPRLERLGPARRAQAPAVARLQPGEAVIGHRRREVVAARFGELEELRRHHGADRVGPHILPARIAAAVAEEAGHRFRRAQRELAAQHIERGARTPAAVASAAPGLIEHHLKLPSSCRCQSLLLPPLAPRAQFSGLNLRKTTEAHCAGSAVLPASSTYTRTTSSVSRFSFLSFAAASRTHATYFSRPNVSRSPSRPNRCQARVTVSRLSRRPLRFMSTYINCPSRGSRPPPS